MLRNILIGIGASALVMMGAVGTGSSNRDFALSIGGAPAVAQVPSILDTLDEIGVLDEGDDDGSDDAGDDAAGADEGDDGSDDADDDAAAGDDDADDKSARAPAPAPRRSVGKRSACEERAQHEDPTGQFAGVPCWARETFGSGSRQR